MSSSRLRIGILGAARIAERRVAPAIRNSANAVTAAIASRDAQRAQGFAERLGIPKAYGSYEALLDDPEVDAVYIPLPNALHCEWTIQAAAHGKHVLCEKPLAADTGEAGEMMAACAAGGVLLMEAFMYRFHPQTEKALELIRSGAIGAVKLVRAAFCFTIADETNIRLDPALAGGSLMDAGTYCVSAARTMIGAEPERALALAQYGAASGVDESMAGVLEFPAGSRPAPFGPSGERPPAATPKGIAVGAVVQDAEAHNPEGVGLTGSRTRAVGAVVQDGGAGLPAGAHHPVARATVHNPERAGHGAIATFECSFHMPYRAVYEVIGERGRIEVPSPFITNNKVMSIVLHHPDDSTERFTFPAVDQYTLMVEHFAACALQRKPLRYAPSESCAQMQALDALRTSARTGRPVTINH